VKRIAEEELAFLHADGKISKKTGLGKSLLNGWTQNSGLNYIYKKWAFKTISIQLSSVFFIYYLTYIELGMDTIIILHWIYWEYYPTSRKLDEWYTQ